MLGALTAGVSVWRDAPEMNPIGVGSFQALVCGFRVGCAWPVPVPEEGSRS